MTTKGPISPGRIKSFIERVEKLIEERKAIQGDIRDVFSEAKGVGYNVPIMRKVIALRAMDASDRAEQEALLDTYMHALETVDRVQARVAAGESVRAVGAAEGISRSTTHRLSQKGDNDGNGTPHDPATGEVREDARQGEDAARPSRTAVARTSLPSHALTIGESNPKADEPHVPSQRADDSTPQPLDLEIPARLDRRHELVRQ